MKILKTFVFLSSALPILSGCQKEPAISKTDKIVSEAGKYTQVGLHAIEAKSTGGKFLKGKKDLSSFELKPVNGNPYHIYKSQPAFSKSDLDQIKKLRSNYDNYVAPALNPATCTTYSNQDPSSSQFKTTDYYSRSTPALVQVAGELGTLTETFEFVKNEVRGVNLFGATQSAETLLKSREGSVVDKANLLVSLLRSKDIPAQYVFGEIYLSEPVAKRYFDTRFVTDILTTLNSVFGGYFNDSGNGVAGSDYFRVVNGQRYFVVPHVWVRAFDGVQWKNFDPTSLHDSLAPGNGEGLLAPTQSVDWANWYFGTDSSGDYIKTKTIIDYLLENFILSSEIEFANSRVEYSGGSYSDNVLSELSPCVVNSFFNLENSDQEYRGEVRLLNSSGTEVLKVNQPLAKLSEERSYISHSAGLYSELSNPASGDVLFKIGDATLGQFSANTGSSSKFTVEMNIYYPKGFAKSVETSQLAEKYQAGEVLATNFFARPTSHRELIDETDRLKKDIEASETHTKLMARVHRLSGLLFQFYASKNFEDGYRLRGFRLLPILIFGTGTKTSAIVTSGQSSKEFGLLPTRPSIDARVNGGPYTNSPYDELAYDGWEKNAAAFRQENGVSGSDAEATIWEKLFGVQGYSAVRALQMAAKVNSVSPGTYSYLQGVELNSSGISYLYSHIDPASELYDWIPTIDSEFGMAGSFFWSANKDVVDPTYGDKVRAYIVDGGAFNPGILAFSLVSFGSSYLKKVAQENSSISNLNGGLLGSASSRGSNNFWERWTEKVSGYISSESIEPLGGGGSSGSSPAATPSQGQTSTTGPGRSVACSGNPVDYVTGLMWHSFTDFNLKGHTPSTGLFLQRTYFTLPAYQSSGNWTDTGDLGKGWVHNFDMRLLDGAKDGSGNLTMAALHSGTTNVLWITEAGNTVLFTYGGGVYTPPSGFNESLTVSGSTYVLTTKGNVKYIFKKDLASNFNGRLTSITDPHGENLTVNYDGNGRLQTVSSPFAGDLVFFRDGNNKLSSVKNSKTGLQVKFEISGGKLSKSYDFDGNETTYQYNQGQTGTAANGLLSSIVDPIGRSIRFEYFQNGKAFREIGLGNAEQVYQYAPYLYQKYTRVTAPNGGTMEYRYDNDFRVVLEVNPDGSRKFRKWNGGGRVEWEKDGMGHATYFTYDSRGNRTGVKKPESNGYETAVYDQTFDIPTKIVPRLGSQTQIALNANGDVISVSRDIFGNSVSTSFTYDSFGTKLSTKTDIGTFANQSNSEGQTITEFHSRNPSSLKYDARNRVTERKFANGRVLRYVYDNFDRITYLEDSHGPHTKNFYDVAGRMIKSERIAGTTVHTAQFSYDDRDRLISSINFNGEKTDYKYDIVGAGCLIQDKPSQISQPDGKITKFSYDSMGRKTKETLPDGSTILYGYNLRGDLTSVMDGLGNLTQYQYDGNRRLIKTLGQSAGWQSTQGGSPIVGYMPEETIFTYDESDRMLTKQQILNDERHLDGRLVTEFEYDPLDRIKKKTVSHKRGNALVETFDQVSFQYTSQIGDSTPTLISNKYLALKFARETQPPYSLISYSQEPTAAGSAIGIEKHMYKVMPDMNGPLALLARNNVNTILQTYDPAGRLKSSAGTFSGSSNSVTFTHDEIGRITGINHSSGLSGVYSYDNSDRVTAIDWTGSSPNISEDLTYTKSGLISQIVREIGTFNYSYTPRNEVAAISYSGSETLSSSYVNTSLTYDLAGNITNYRGASFQNFSNFIKQVGSSSYVPSSDGLGRLKYRYESSNTHEFRYYPEGQLRRFKVYDSNAAVTKTVDYYYDGLGRRISKVIQVPGQNTIYITYSHLADQDKILLGKYKQGATTEETLYVDGQGIDEHLFEISSDTGIKSYKRDHLGSVLNSAAIGGKSVYGLYGENLGTAVSTSTFSEPVTYGYTGREYENELGGCYNYRARTYCPGMSVFLTKDLLRPEQGGDLISYRIVKNNPLIYVDPFGLNERDFQTAVGYAQAHFGDQLRGTTFQMRETAPGVMGYYSPLSNTITISDRFSPSIHPLSDAGARALLDTVFHEAGHATQSSFSRFQSGFQDLAAILSSGNSEAVGDIHTQIGNEAANLTNFYFDDYNASRSSPLFGGAACGRP